MPTSLTLAQAEQARSHSYWIGVFMGFCGGNIFALQMLHWLGRI